MIVVSDTSPLNYLVLINAIGVLPKLFGEVYVNLIDLDAAFTALAQTTFQTTQELLDSALARHAARKQDARE